MSESRKKKSTGSYGGILFGLAVIAFGVLWMLSQLGYLLMAPFWQYWPSLVILVGLGNLLQRNQGVGHRVFALMLIAFGAVVQLVYLGWIALSWSYIWPAAVIAGGLLIALSSIFHRNKKRHHCGPVMHAVPEDVAVFGGRDERVHSADWPGGEVTAIFGDYKIDLRDADMEGDEVELQATAIFGGVELRVPDHWAVQMKGSPILGAFEDKTRPPRLDLDQPPKTLVLSGAAIFGGVEVRN